MIMETERFEALIDAILAIMITIIVMEIPLPESTTLAALLKLAPEFISYLVSFVICFNVWMYHHNLFNIVNKLNSNITWNSAIGMMVIGLLPHVTSMISTDFNSFVAQFMFGLIFFITNINFYVTDLLLLRMDRANIALALTLEDRKKMTLITSFVQIFGVILGYLYYPPAIFVSCILSMIIMMSWNKLKNLVR